MLRQKLISNESEIVPDKYKQLKSLMQRFTSILKKNMEKENELITKNNSIKLKILEYVSKNKEIAQRNQIEQ